LTYPLGEGHSARQRIFVDALTVIELHSKTTRRKDNQSSANRFCIGRNYCDKPVFLALTNKSGVAWLERHDGSDTNVRLVLAETFAGRHFDPKDAPDLRTVREWVRLGKLPGREIGRRTYVDEEAFLRSTRNELADKILGQQAA
jgi:hypothetical protein